MLQDRVSNPGPLTYESGALSIALRGPAISIRKRCVDMDVVNDEACTRQIVVVALLFYVHGNQYFVHILSPVTDNCPS